MEGKSFWNIPPPMLFFVYPILLFIPENLRRLK